MLRASLAVALVAAGCGDPTGPEREISGQVLYEQYCARCHGSDGKPLVPFAKDLSDRAVVDEISDMAFKGVIKSGRPDRRNADGEIVSRGMPAFGEQFTEATLMVLLAYVRSFSGSQGPHAREDDPDPVQDAP